MTLAALSEIGPLAKDQQISVHEPDNAVRFYKAGLRSSPWSEERVVSKIALAEQEINERVLGQGPAVGTVAGILARAALGLSGAQSEGHENRPQGVMMLAGPTGVGKTEVAKQIAKLVFGREDAMVRFDMSEFRADHTEARLLGAPPGYVGHDAGGELTNAVRRDPFCLLLFDEIEKAHVRILDKFLQILEDGRLTDGAGSTVHFGEALIVFTTNLGIYELDEHQKPIAVVTPGEKYEDIKRKVDAGVLAAFKEINRPELLNRIGPDNVVVFDFITPEVAKQLLRRALANVAQRVESRVGTTVAFGAELLGDLDKIVVAPERLAFGGRAVLSVVESHVINPLAKILIASRSATSVRVERHDLQGNVHKLVVTGV